MENIKVVTTNDIPGYKVVEVYGEVFGLIVRSRNLFSNMGANFRTIFGGEVGGYTKLLTKSREQAVGRLRQAASDQGANAVLAMRFDTGDIGQVMNEVAAYGTAVRIEKL
ncbi:MAG TPA: YbjQ family protein [Candidatus Saccharimonadia bacterium]|nr:YbjQ family protein [Candidatus Saccharimonadia bacterium]